MDSPSSRQRRESPSSLSTPTPATTVTTTVTRPPIQLPPAVLLIYPVTLFVGSLFSVISPTARPPRHHIDPLAPTIAADLNLDPPAHPINYFARKNNIFNQYFVKLGWAWTTFAFFILLVSQHAFRLRQQSANNQQRLRRISQALIRYALATLVWYLTTQWFFGPPIIDRGFIFTGGKCESRLSASLPGEHHHHHHFGTLFTAASCKAAGGDWKGGYDVSGHVFLLVLAMVFLGFEAVGVSLSDASLEGLNRKEKEDVDAVTQSSDQTEREDPFEESVLRVWALRFVYGVIGLSWWMLLMTAIWFHTWLEKVSFLYFFFHLVISLTDAFSGPAF